MYSIFSCFLEKCNIFRLSFLPFPFKKFKNSFDVRSMTTKTLTVFGYRLMNLHSAREMAAR